MPQGFSEEVHVHPANHRLLVDVFWFFVFRKMYWMLHFRDADLVGNIMPPQLFYTFGRIDGRADCGSVILVDSYCIH